jgi:hypothetical protein
MFGKGKTMTDHEAAMREGYQAAKREINATLTRIMRRGQAAYQVAVTMLSSEMTMAEIEAACAQVPAESVHRDTFTADRGTMEREPSAPQESVVVAERSPPTSGRRLGLGVQSIKR